jgi:hypothetical protein
MRVFSQGAAAHFCSSSPTLVVQEEVVQVVARNGGRRLTEGSSEFEAYRQNLLREAEHQYYQSVSSFRRAHTLMLPSSAYWAHVTLYYASWYAAHALLSIFGVWLGLKRYVEVVHDSPGSQALKVVSHSLRGSHRSFWSSFYDSVRPLKAIVDVQLLPALEPVSNNPMWQIDTRNRINYHVAGVQLVRASFLRSFDPASFPGSLSGDLATQYEITRCMVAATAEFFLDLSVSTDAFPARDISLRDEVWTAAPVDVVVASDAQVFVI